VIKISSLFLVILLIFLPNFIQAGIYSVNVDQDTDVISGTQWVGESMSNQGANPEIEPIRANDGYNTKHTVYLGFDLLSNSVLQSALSNGESIDKLILYAYNVRSFAMGDAGIKDVITSLYYVNNDNWWEGPYTNWTSISSLNPLDGMTYSNQVGYNNYLASESEDDSNKWYSWIFSANDIHLGGVNDNVDYLSLAMVPNELQQSSSWWLVSSFASKENLTAPHPYMEVYTTTIPEPASVALFGIGGLTIGAIRKRQKNRRGEK
jgi:hypothetical protein